MLIYCILTTKYCVLRCKQYDVACRRQTVFLANEDRQVKIAVTSLSQPDAQYFKHGGICALVW